MEEKRPGANAPQGNSFADKMAAILWEKIDLEQLDQLLTAGANTEQAFISVITEIAQEAQENTAAQEVQGDPTDPTSPLFDIEAWKAAVAEAGGYTALQEHINAKFDEAFKPLEPTAAKIAQTLKKAITESARSALTGISNFINSDSYKAFKENIEAIGAYVEANRAELVKLSELAEEAQPLLPFLKLEIEEAKNDPEFANLSLRDFTLSDIVTQGLDKNGNPTQSKFRTLIERAKQRQKDYETSRGIITGIDQAVEELPRIIYNPTEKLNYPLDKPNSVIWNLIETATKESPEGQLRLAIDTSKKGGDQNAIIYYGINFDELPAGVTITKQLTQYDKRVYIAAAALFREGNETITASQIYSMMGNTTTPNTDDLNKVNDSITKMGAAHVYIDNQKETQVMKNYAHFQYDAALLPFERISAYINGHLTESAIHLFREPPLMEFARQRKQITTISRHLLESPANKTEANMRIEDYLLERIGHMKNGKGNTPRKMLYSTIYERCKIKTTKQKQRAPQKIRTYLDFYKKEKWIKGYTEDADSITILL